MSDNPQGNLLEQLAAQLATIQGQSATSTPAAAAGWQKPAVPEASAAILGVSIPISLDTPAGKIRVYLNFTGSAASSPDALMALVQQLHTAGLPLDVWQPRDSGGWGSGRGGSGSGWNRGGNSGWRR